MIEQTDVAIIGAGPAGSVAAALLRQQGHAVTVIEQSQFPRFSIGESLLPQCMVFLEEAGLADRVAEEGFQYKNGAVFARGDRGATFDFEQKFSEGPFATYQVQRGRFDHVLAEGAQAAGADIRFGQRIEAANFSDTGGTLTVSRQHANDYQLNARFVLDASGFGRVLPRLLDLDKPSSFPSRRSVFTHIEDNIVDPSHDRSKILIVIHPEHKDVWYWLIPFSNGRSSLGVVSTESYLGTSLDEAQLLKQAVSESPNLSALLSGAVFDTDVRSIKGYACDVSSLAGPSYALLGNAGEFLDPVFSSGVTIAMKSASLACPLVNRQLNGEEFDWHACYDTPLRTGVNTFRAYVDAWYDGSFQEAIFSPKQTNTVREMICSILAGYAWDQSNPFVANPVRKLRSIVHLCRED